MHAAAKVQVKLGRGLAESISLRGTTPLDMASDGTDDARGRALASPG